MACVPGRQTSDAQGVPTWKFGEVAAGKPVSTDPYHLLVRSHNKRAAAQRGTSDLQIHIELNVVPEANADDEVAAGSMDPAARRRARQVDEVCVAWGRCPWPDDFNAGSTQIDIQLVGAGVEAPMALAPSHLASARAASMWRRHTVKGKLLAKGPTLSVKMVGRCRLTPGFRS